MALIPPNGFVQNGPAALPRPKSVFASKMNLEPKTGFSL
jgi:hypothetical protein